MTRTKKKAEIVVDGDLSIFARNSLTKAIERAAAKPHPRLKLAAGEIVPIIVLEGCEWDTTIEVYEWDSWGIAAILAPNANDGGRVGIFARKMSYPVRTISDFTLVPWAEIQTAAAKNVDIDSRYAMALLHGIDKELNKIGYSGEPDFGLQGIFTSQLSRTNFAVTFANATPTQLYSMVTNAANMTVLNSNTIWQPKIMVMPQKQHDIFGSTMRSDGSDLSVMTQFLTNQKALGGIEEIIIDNSLKGKGDNGSDAILFLPYDDEPNSDEVETDTGEALHPVYMALTLEAYVPPEFQQWDDTNYRERMVCRTAGIVVTDPTSGLIASGA